MNRHARPEAGGWFTPARVQFGLRQVASAVIGTLAAGTLAFLWHAVTVAGHRVEQLTDEIRARPTAATSSQVQQLTDAVRAIPTPGPAQVLVRPAGPGAVAVTVLPAPPVPQQGATPRQPSPAPSSTPAPSKAASGPLCTILGLSCERAPTETSGRDPAAQKP